MPEASPRWRVALPANRGPDGVRSRLILLVCLTACAAPAAHTIRVDPTPSTTPAGSVTVHPALRAAWLVPGDFAARVELIDRTKILQALAEVAAAQERLKRLAVAVPTPAGPIPTGVPLGTATAGDSCGGDLPSCCTLQKESHGDPWAVEPGHLGAPSGDPGDPWHHASGLWQFMPSTWNNYRGYPYAAAAPVEVQNAKAREVFANGAGWANWKGDHCYVGG